MQGSELCSGGLERRRELDAESGTRTAGGASVCPSPTPAHAVLGAECSERARERGAGGPGGHSLVDPPADDAGTSERVSESGGASGAASRDCLC